MNPTPTLPEIRQRTAGAYANMGVTLTTATGTQTAAIVEQLSGGPDHRGGSSKLAHALSAGVPPKNHYFKK